MFVCFKGCDRHFTKVCKITRTFLNSVKIQTLRIFLFFPLLCWLVSSDSCMGVSCGLLIVSNIHNVGYIQEILTFFSFFGQTIPRPTILCFVCFVRNFREIEVSRLVYLFDKKKKCAKIKE